MGLELLARVPNTAYKPLVEPVIPGNPVEIEALWTTGEGKGAPLEPTAVVLKILPPEGAVETVVATKKSTGIWTYKWEPLKQGRWWFRWFGEGVSAGETSFTVAAEKV